MGRVSSGLPGSRYSYPLRWGMYANSVVFVDIATGGTEQLVVWGKGETGALEQIEDIEKTLPFPILGFDCNNGGTVPQLAPPKTLCRKKKPVRFTRSRAYHKDDNTHIEQKNRTRVRQWIGYESLNNPRVVPLLNDLYTKEWRLFHNLFCPSVKLFIHNIPYPGGPLRSHKSPHRLCRVALSPDKPVGQTATSSEASYHGNR